MRDVDREESHASERPVGVALSARYLPELESLRGIAMLLVFFFHLDVVIRGTLLRVGEVVVSPALAYVVAGHSGVDLFFVLSAFLLCLPFLAQAAGGKPVSVPYYFARRALRILPLYYAAVIVGSILRAATPADLLRGLPYLFFLNGFAGMTTALVPYSNVWWSLATEAQFYVVLPFLPLVLRSRLGRLAGAAAVVLWAGAYAAFLRGQLQAQTIEGQLMLGLSLFGRAPLFLAGIAAAWFYLHHGEYWRRRLAAVPLLRNGGADLFLLALITTLGYLLRWAVWIGAARVKGPPFHAWHVPVAVLWAALLVVLLIAPLRLKALFSNRVLNRLGVLSYSIYIVHVPVQTYALYFCRHRWTSFLGWNAYTALTASVIGVLCVALAELTYRAIERPFLIRKEQLRTVGGGAPAVQLSETPG
jgi:peptidoglycan/LPS O-acetylase OafA/YrhL